MTAQTQTQCGPRPLQSTETDTTTKVFSDKNPINLTAQISGKTVTIEYDGTDYDIYKNKDLATSTPVTLTITASDSTTNLNGTYTPTGGQPTPFSTNDAPRISQVFTASQRTDSSVQWAFSVQLDSSGARADPTLILRTKSSGDVLE